MRCRLETECTRLEDQLKIETQNRDEWRTWYHEQRKSFEEWVEKWFDKLGEHGIDGDTLEQRLVALEGAYLTLSKEAASQHTTGQAGSHSQITS